MGTAALDVERLRRIAQGDRRAFELLFEDYRPRVYRYLWRLTGNAADADEAANDVLVAVWRNAARFEARSKPATWIFGIAHHHGLNALRRRPRGEPLEPDSPSGEDLDAALLTAARTEAVRDAIGKLSPLHRAVIELAFDEEMPYEEIASVMTCPVSTVKTRMFHARRNLAAILGKEIEQ